jgi:hypothetical protein
LKTKRESPRRKACLHLGCASVFSTVFPAADSLRASDCSTPAHADDLQVQLDSESFSECSQQECSQQSTGRDRRHRTRTRGVPFVSRSIGYLRTVFPQKLRRRGSPSTR